MAGVVHITEEEATRDFGVIMKHVRSGDEVRLDCNDGVTAVVKRADRRQAAKARSFADADEANEVRKVPQTDPPLERRTIAEAFEILRLRKETQELAVPDPDMATDMEEIHSLYNQPMDMSRWG